MILIGIGADSVYTELIRLFVLWGPGLVGKLRHAKTVLEGAHHPPRAELGSTTT